MIALYVAALVAITAGVVGLGYLVYALIAWMVRR